MFFLSGKVFIIKKYVNEKAHIIFFSFFIIIRERRMWRV